VSKKDVFTQLVAWRDEIETEARRDHTPPERVDEIVGRWHMDMRLQGKPAALMRSELALCL